MPFVDNGIDDPAGTVVSRDTSQDGPRTLTPVPDGLYRVIDVLPTADPHIAGIMWNNAGTVVESAG
jgi:hypothetical protein